MKTKEIYDSYYKNIILLKKHKRTKINFFSAVYLIFIYLISKFISLFFKYNINSTESISISWSNTHTNQLNKILANCIVLNLNKIDNSKIFKIYFYNIFKEIFTLLRHDSPLYYKILFVFEYNLFKSIIDSNKKVFISGHFDRITIIISHICKHNNIELTVVQHGALEYFENMPKIYVSNVIYMYKFSEHYFRKYYYPIKNEIIYIYNQDLVSDVDKFLNCKLEKKTIAFLTQPEKINFNILIIKAMLTCRDKYNLNIILHPRDKKNDYKEFFNEPSIVFSRNFCLNYHAVVTRSSTLGINFHNKNVKTIFVNLEGLQMDFYDIENIILINNLNNLDSLLNE